MKRLDSNYTHKDFVPYDDYFLVEYKDSHHSELFHSVMSENDRRNIGRWGKILALPRDFKPKGENIDVGDEVLIEKHKGYYIDYLGFPKNYMLVRYKRLMAIKK